MPINPHARRGNPLSIRLYSIDQPQGEFGFGYAAQSGTIATPDELITQGNLI
ncbi:MAG: hypothetical protein HOP19_05430 [Acidobacteria bacterium]|nr:hypothetical protein [Acidobacteriota bacterium]